MFSNLAPKKKEIRMRKCLGLDWLSIPFLFLSCQTIIINLWKLGLAQEKESFLERYLRLGLDFTKKKLLPAVGKREMNRVSFLSFNLLDLPIRNHNFGADHRFLLTGCWNMDNCLRKMNDSSSKQENKIKKFDPQLMISACGWIIPSVLSSGAHKQSTVRS